jgi:hypothetical protein
MTHGNKLSDRSLRLIQRALIAVGTTFIIAGLIVDLFGIGTPGFGVGPTQTAVILVGLSVIIWSVLLRLQHPFKRYICLIALGIMLYLLWSFWLFPVSGYNLNPLSPASLSGKVLVVSQFFILFLAGGSAGLAVWNNRDYLLKIKKQSKKTIVSYESSTFQNTDKYTVRAFALLLTFLMACVCFFVYPVQEGDDLGLYNPVYTYLINGKMTYPACFGISPHFEAMIAHPPVRYLIIAWLMKLGLNSFYATSFPIFLIFLLGVSLIVTSRFKPYEKIAFLFGIFAPIVLFHTRSVAEGPLEVQAPLGPVLFDSLGSAVSIRPDLSLALGWFIGLLTLESARIEGWNTRKLLLGSFLLTSVSGLHYYGSFAWAGIGVYIIYALHDCNLKIGLKKSLWIVFGACCFGIPYLILFVIPHFGDIVNYALSVQNNASIQGAVNRHIGQYIYNQQVLSGERSPYILMFLRPVWSLKTPLALFAWIFLLIPKNTRGLALSSLSLILFICFYLQGKSNGYYIPENMIYLSGISLLLLWAIQAGASKIFPSGKARYIFPLGTFCLMIACIKGNPYFEQVNISLKPYRHEMHLARACAKEIVGSNAVVAGRLELWYASGAEHWYDIYSDLIWNPDISHIDLSTYFSQFDAIVDQHHFANFTLNNLSATLSSWYADKVLYLKGIYLTNSGPGLNILIFSGQQNERKRLLGYGLYRRDLLYRFERDMFGDYMFVSVIGPTFGNYNELQSNSLFYNGIPLPNTDDSPNLLVSIQKIQHHIYTFLLPRNVYDAVKETLAPEIRIRDEIPCRITPANPDELLQKLLQDPPIKFYRAGQKLSAKVLKTKSY